MIALDVVCPLYNAAKYIDELYKKIVNQKNVTINKIIFPLTKSSDNTRALIGRMNAVIVDIEVKDFSHSLTRELCIRDYCTSPVVIMLTQDVKILDDNLFFNLAKEIVKKEVAFSFAKQVCSKKTIEKYIRESNYPDKSYFVEKKDIKELQLKAFYSSDACAAYDREIFLSLNGFDTKDIIVSEDMYYCYKLIMNGYRFMYCADAVVEHSHNLSFKEIYQRYYKIGKFFYTNPQFSEYKSTSGFKLALYVLKRCIIEFNFIALLKFLPDMTSRYLGMKKGKSGK